MALVYVNNSSSSGSDATEAPFSVLTKSGESLFLCSTRDGHICYHGCQRHGRYPLWSDADFMDDDVMEEDEEDIEKEMEGTTSMPETYSDEEWLSDDDDVILWMQRQALERRRCQERIEYSPTDLRLIEDSESDAPIVGVIASKPPPEYVWHVMEDGDAWMRGSLPEKISDELDGTYYRYRYGQWDVIPDDFSDDGDDGGDDEVAAATTMHNRSWSDMVDQQERRQLLL